MRRSLPALLVLAALVGGAVGCGSDDDGRATDPPAPVSSSAAPGSETPSEDASAGSGAELVDLVTQTAVGGEVGTAAVLSDPAAASAFLGQFSGTMAGQLQELADATSVPDGMVAYAAVVALGCDVPDDVRISEGAGGLVVEAVPVSAPKQECLAAMTTVAFLLVPADAV